MVSAQRCLRLIFLVQVAATWAMVGVIWFVQVVHYPLFSVVGEETFAAYEGAHLRLTPWVVGPLMMAEAITALLLLWRRSAGVTLAQAWAGVALLAVIWLVTDFVQLPKHEALSHGFDASVQHALVVTNWIRTLAWSARGILVLGMAARGRE